MLEGYTKNIFGYDITYSKEKVVKTKNKEYKFKLVLKSKIYKKDSWVGYIYGYDPEITSYGNEIELFSTLPNLELQRCINFVLGTFYEMEKNILENCFTK